MNRKFRALILPSIFLIAATLWTCQVATSVAPATTAVFALIMFTVTLLGTLYLYDFTRKNLKIATDKQ